MAPNISQHYINRNCTFMNQMYTPVSMMWHRTAGHVNVKQLEDYWNSSCVSSHFGISYPGYGYHPHDIWQYVRLTDGAGANCCTNSGAHPFFTRRGGNANTYTISCEICTPDTNNDNDITPEQEEAIIYLGQYIAREMGVPVNHYFEWWNDYETSHDWIDPNNGGFGMHRCIAPHDKRMCVGRPYYSGQMDRIHAAIQGGKPVTAEEDEDMYVPLKLNEPFTTTLPETGTIWLSAAQGIAVIYIAYYHWETKRWTSGNYTVDSNKGPISIADVAASDITQVLAKWTGATPTNPPEMCATISIIK